MPKLRYADTQTFLEALSSTWWIHKHANGLLQGFASLLGPDAIIAAPEHCCAWIDGPVAHALVLADGKIGHVAASEEGTWTGELVKADQVVRIEAREAQGRDHFEGAEWTVTRWGVVLADGTRWEVLARPERDGTHAFIATLSGH